MKVSIIEVDQHEIELSNEDKIMFPRDKITKGDLIDYYYRIAPIMLPYVRYRPLTMQRFPGGITQEGFYQKDASDYFSDWIRRMPIARKDDGMVNYVVCNNTATLVYLTNQLCVTYHVWLSRVDKLDYPDRMIFDLDPSGSAGFKRVRWAAKKLKYLLDRIGLKSFVMTTGSRGLHVTVPLKRKHTFDEVRAFAREMAEDLIARYPQKLTLEMRKTKRGDRVFLDILRNTHGFHGVAPYSVRAKPGAPVATPITWDDLFKRRVTPQQFTIRNIFRRLARKADPWADMMQFAQKLGPAQKKLRGARIDLQEEEEE